MVQFFRNKLCAAALMLAVTAACAQTDLIAKAKTLVTDLMAGKYGNVEAQFNPTMHTEWPVSKLLGVVLTLKSQFGDLKSIVGTRQLEEESYRIVYVSCSFAGTTLDIKVVFDSMGQVAGLFFVPAKTRSSSTPVDGSGKAADVVGDWIGALDVGATRLWIVFHITSGTAGLKATIDSPDQNKIGLPAGSVQVNGSIVTVESEVLNVIYEGALSTDQSTLDGTWKQGILESPLKLKRVKDKAELAPPARPQNPVKPYPYHEEDVSYENKVQGNKLGATLTIPAGKGPFPAVVLITGSGPQDRDETLMGHKPFLVLADYLTRRGIAVLRADDRGVGKSTGEFSGATTADFATDTEAGIAYLKTRPEVNSKMIGLIGHSEGGIIAPMVAARNHDVAFIVMLAGSGVRGDEILVTQAELLAEASGQSHEEAMKAEERQRKILELVTGNFDDANLEKQMHEELAGEMTDAQIRAIVRQLNIRWLRYFLIYDPVQALRKVTCPALVLNGEKDLQVPPKQNLPPIRKALKDGGNKNFEVDELPGLNHLFQTAKTGSPAEYAEIEETMAPVVLEKVSSWILRLNR
ncbi:MAG TPA: alpha/beta fold hydrolase [Candidatus Angelobacter sp.]